MIKRKKLGQHFLNSQLIASKIVLEANIGPDDTVYEIGTGLGILTRLLCKKAKKVISIEADKNLFIQAQTKFVTTSNLSLKFGDGFKNKNRFTIFVSNLPYSKSKKAIEFLASTPFSHGVIMVQKEFAEKIMGEKEKRSIQIIANHCFEIKRLFKVGKENFSPPPKIDSVVLKIEKKINLDKELIKIINKIFSYKRKKVSNILKQFGMENSSNQRLEELSNKEIIDLASKIYEK
ncbi:MAG: rRNA adenine dimethyltransferase family protein [Nitrosopumilaceae archaeon]|nr:rRNA adenine dimethyltransferase family protein [Nitrosopumilaceae archaeon]